MAVKRTRWRSSGTRQAFVNQENTYAFSWSGASSVSEGASASASISGTSASVVSSASGSSAGARVNPLALLLHDGLAERVGGAARLLDLLARGGGEGVRRHGQLLHQVALAEDLHVRTGVLDQALLDERLERDLGAVVEDAVEVPKVDRDRRGAVRADRHGVLRVGAALLAQTHVDRHGAALGG